MATLQHQPRTKISMACNAGLCNPQRENIRGQPVGYPSACREVCSHMQAQRRPCEASLSSFFFLFSATSHLHLELLESSSSTMFWHFPVLAETRSLDRGLRRHPPRNHCVHADLRCFIHVLRHPASRCSRGKVAQLQPWR